VGLEVNAGPALARRSRLNPSRRPTPPNGSRTAAYRRTNMAQHDVWLGRQLGRVAWYTMRPRSMRATRSATRSTHSTFCSMSRMPTRGPAAPSACRGIARRGRGAGEVKGLQLCVSLPRLHLSNEGLCDSAGEMACNRVHESDEINMMIGFIRDGADHNKRDIPLITHLSHGSTLHFYTECVR